MEPWLPISVADLYTKNVEYHLLRVDIRSS